MTVKLDCTNPVVDQVNQNNSFMRSSGSDHSLQMVVMVWWEGVGLGGVEEEEEEGLGISLFQMIGVDTPSFWCYTAPYWFGVCQFLHITCLKFE